MAIGTQFGELIDMLKNELGRSTNVGVGVDDRPQLMHHINRAYSTLYLKHDWPHLRSIATRISLQAGDRYYDMPSTIDLTGIESVTCWQGNTPIEMDRGIGVEEYAAFDSVNDVRSDPAMKWDTRFTGSATQIEVWPIPATDENELEIKGKFKIAKMVDDEDLCWLDDDLVVLAAAARLLARQKSDDAPVVRDELNSHLTYLKGSAGPTKTVVMGGATEPARRRWPHVSIAGR